MSIIQPNTENYVNTRTAGGKRSQHNGSPVAVALAGLTVEEVKDVAEAMGIEEVDKYDKLNPGQIRMNLGNRIRGRMKAIETENAKAVADSEKEDATAAQKKAAAKLKSPQEQLDEACKIPHRARDQRERERKAAREEREAAAAKAKEEKEAKAKAAKAKAA